MTEQPHFCMLHGWVLGILFTATALAVLPEAWNHFAVGIVLMNSGLLLGIRTWQEHQRWKDNTP